MDTGAAIVSIFKFYISCLQQIYDILSSFEILPGISYLRFMLALILISICIKLIRFSFSKSETYVDNELVHSGLANNIGWGPFSKTKTHLKSLKKKKGIR